MFAKFQKRCKKDVKKAKKLKKGVDNRKGAMLSLPCCWGESLDSGEKKSPQSTLTTA